MTIPPESERILQEQVDAGRYPSIQEALTEAVRLLVLRERRRTEVGIQVQPGVEQPEHGQFTETEECEIDDFYDEKKTAATAALGLDH